MPLIDDSDDEVEEFMVTSENLSASFVFFSSDYCTYFKRMKSLLEMQGHMYCLKFFLLGLGRCLSL